jgi:hypothetical protein
MSDSKRKKLIQLIHVGRSTLGWDGEAYQAFLGGVTGKESAADMTEKELEKVLREMRRVGFAVKPRRVNPDERGRATLAQLEYIKGMWAVCARNKSDAALLAFVKRIATADALRFLDVDSARKVILALRDMTAKAGFAPDTSARLEEAGGVEK